MLGFSWKCNKQKLDGLYHCLLVVLFENRVPRMAIILGSTSCVDLPIHLSRFFFTSFVGVHLVAFAALRVDCHDRLVACISSRSSRQHALYNMYYIVCLYSSINRSYILYTIVIYVYNAQTLQASTHQYGVLHHNSIVLYNTFAMSWGSLEGLYGGSIWRVYKY